MRDGDILQLSQRLVRFHHSHRLLVLYPGNNTSYMIRLFEKSGPASAPRAPQIGMRVLALALSLAAWSAVYFMGVMVYHLVTGNYGEEGNLPDEELGQVEVERAREEKSAETR